MHAQRLSVIHVTDLCEEIFQNEPVVDVSVYPDRTVLSGMDIVHLFVKDRGGSVFPFAAVIEQNDADGRGVAETAVFLRTFHGRRSR